MARVEMRLDGESPAAGTVLKAAQSFLRLLRAIEKEITGKRPSVRWEIDILTGRTSSLIVLRSEGAASETHELVALEAADRAFREIKTRDKEAQ